MPRDFQSPGRSTVYAGEAMAATSHPLASEAAVSIMRAGGNAVDAAIAASAVLCVVEPHMTGIGGDCFVMLCEPDGRLIGLNGSGQAALRADAAALRAQGLAAIDPYSAHAVTAPGAVRAWETLSARFGRLGFERCFERAIDLAEKGHPVAPRVAWDWTALVPQISGNAGARRHLLDQGKAPGEGAVVTFPALARTMRRIADEGAAGFYQGAVAEDIVRTVAVAKGSLALEDLAAVEAQWLDPVSRTYRGADLYELPPNGQGITALIQLGILSHFDQKNLDPRGGARLHLEIEAARLAYAVRDAFVADPRSMTVPLDELLSDSFASDLSSRIHPEKRLETGDAGPVPGGDTVYLTTADGEGRVVSFINSLFHGFGSGLVTEETGVVLHNRGAGFTLEEDHPNMLAPGRRPLHTIIPAMLKAEDEVTGFGVMGGQYQACGHAHVVSNLLDFGMDPQAALDAPRIFWNDNGDLEAEAGISDEAVSGLDRRGHRVRPAEKPIGGGQMVKVDRRRGVLSAGSDPRKDGCALGY